MLLLALSMLLSVPDDRLSSESRDGIELLSDLSSADQDEVLRLAALTVSDATRRLESWGLRARRSVTTSLRVYGSMSSYEAFRKRTRDSYTPQQSQSFYNPDDPQVVCAWTDGSEEAAGQLRRQVARHVLTYYAKDAPHWLDEGFGGYYEGLHLDRYGDLISDLHEDYLATIRDAIVAGESCPLDTLMELRKVDFYGFAGARNVHWSKPTLYAQSWSLVFFLIRSETEDDKAFRELVMRRATTGRWSKGPLRRALPGVIDRWKELLARDDLDFHGELMRRGWSAFASEDYREARAAASRVLGLDEEHHSARRLLAHCCLALGDAPSALVSFQRVLERAPQDLDALIGSARAMLLLAREEQTQQAVDDAITAATAVVEHAPDGMRHVGYGLCADAAEILGNDDRALEFVREALRDREMPAVVRADFEAREDDLVRRVLDKGR